MATYNIVNEDGQEGYTFLKDPAMVSSVEGFLETIDDSGVISKNMVVSLEETIADKIITDKYSLNMFTNEPSKIGVKEAKNVIKNVLSGDEVQRDATYTLNDIAIVLNKNINLLNNTIDIIDSINYSINIELIEKIKSGEVKYYNDNDILTDIKEFDIVEVIRYARYYKENSTLFNNNALNIVNKQYEKNENLIPDMVFLRLFSLIGMSEDADLMDILTNSLERYTVGDVVEKLSSLNELIDALSLTKKDIMEVAKENSIVMFNNKTITKYYKILSRIYDILVNDTTTYYIALFTKQ